MDCENFGIAGVGLYLSDASFVERLKLAKDGVVGLGGKVSEEFVGEARLEAR
jgi:hypothetical protein